MGGASLETFSGEAQLKKPPCIILLFTWRLVRQSPTKKCCRRNSELSSAHELHNMGSVTLFSEIQVSQRNIAPTSLSFYRQHLKSHPRECHFSTNLRSPRRVERQEEVESTERSEGVGEDAPDLPLGPY